MSRRVAEPGTTELRDDAAQVTAATRTWLERAVIGLNLCPFARQAYHGNRVRFVVSEAADTAALLLDLRVELQFLQQAQSSECETTLIIHPYVLGDFLLYNDFLDDSDALLDELQLHGELQIVSFHPDYQFANTELQDMENFSNRSPYPMLHLLREASISRVVDEHPDIDSIVTNNQHTLRALGIEGWRRLWSENH